MNRVFLLLYQTDILRRHTIDCLVSIDREGMLERMDNANLSDEWHCWIEEYKVQARVFEGKCKGARVWVENNIPEARKKDVN